MANLIKFKGVKEVKIKLRKANIKLGRSTEAGLLKGGLFLQRKSQKIVPVEFGFLKSSAGTRVIGKLWRADVVVFYTASYAVYVHERTELQHKKGKEAKFLEKPARIYRVEILRIIAQRAKEI